MSERWRRRRLIVVGLISNSEGRLLLCRMPPDRGVFPGRWCLPGGGVRADETVVEALRREIREELGLAIERVRPLFFRDFLHTKLKHGRTEVLYMVCLLYSCRSQGDRVVLSAEFDEYAWVAPSAVAELDCPRFTIETLEMAGFLARKDDRAR